MIGDLLLRIVFGRLVMKEFTEDTIAGLRDRSLVGLLSILVLFAIVPRNIHILDPFVSRLSPLLIIDTTRALGTVCLLSVRIDSLDLYLSLVAVGVVILLLALNGIVHIDIGTLLPIVSVIVVGSAGDPFPVGSLRLVLSETPLLVIGVAVLTF